MSDRETSVTRCPVHGRLPADEQTCSLCDGEEQWNETLRARRAAQAANALRGVGARVTIMGKANGGNGR